MSDQEFSVWQFLSDGTHECVRGNVGAREAVETAKSYTVRPAAMLGIIHRVIITDGGDATVFEWKNGEGITFPTPAQRVEAVEGMVRAALTTTEAETREAEK